jgi:hypothetical protein
MIDLIRHPKLRRIARDLHIPDSEDALRDIRDHAIETVRAMLREWTRETIDDLRRLGLRPADSVQIPKALPAAGVEFGPITTLRNIF